jgi:ribosomal protein L14E/L6E/L27E
MTRPMIRIHNTKTDEIIDREMNDEEFAEYNQKLENFAKEEAEAAAKAQAKAELLAQLGITEEQAKLLLS